MATPWRQVTGDPVAHVLDFAEDTRWLRAMHPNKPCVITAQQAEGYRKRWEPVSSAMQAELRALTLDEKLRQLDALFLSAQQFGWKPVHAADCPSRKKPWRMVGEFR